MGPISYGIGGNFTPFVLVYEMGAVLPAKIGIPTFWTIHFDEVASEQGRWHGLWLCGGKKVKRPSWLDHMEKAKKRSSLIFKREGSCKAISSDGVSSEEKSV